MKSKFVAHVGEKSRDRDIWESPEWTELCHAFGGPGELRSKGTRCYSQKAQRYKESRQPKCLYFIRKSSSDPRLLDISVGSRY